MSNPLNSPWTHPQLFEATPDAILIANFDNEIIQEANPYVFNMLGFAPEKLLGKKLWEADFFIDHQEIKSCLKIAKEMGYVRNSNLPMQHADGKTIYVEVLNTVVKLNGDQFIQCIIRDITERIRYQAELQFLHDNALQVKNDIIDSLACMINDRDTYTAGHLLRVADLSLAIARKLNLPSSMMDSIRTAAILHDVGKVNIPLEILRKPVALNKVESIMLMGHARMGYEILKHINIPSNIAEAVWQHHERINGSGYPLGLKGDKICPEAKIIAVADTVDSYMHDRPYRKSRDVEASLKLIGDGRGTLFDSEAVTACLGLFQVDGYIFPSPVPFAKTFNEVNSQFLSEKSGAEVQKSGALEKPIWP